LIFLLYKRVLVLTAANISIKNLAKKLPDLLQQKVTKFTQFATNKFSASGSRALAQIQL